MSAVHVTARNEAAQLLIPELAAGTCQIEVITQYGSSNGLLKEPHTALFYRTVKVRCSLRPYETSSYARMKHLHTPAVNIFAGEDYHRSNETPAKSPLQGN